MLFVYLPVNMENIQEKKDILEKLTKSQEAIKKKYNLLKDNKYYTQKVLDKTFKGITDPFQKLVTLIDKKKSVEDEKIIKPEKDLQKKESRKLQSENIKFSNDSDNSEQGQSKTEISSLYDTVNESEATVTDPIERVQSYLHNIDKNHVSELDLMTGVRKHNGKLMIRNSPISFKSDSIYVGQSKFPCSFGLIELLFKKYPTEEDFTKDDLNMYKKVLELSSAHRKQYKSDGDIKATRSIKNSKIILPLFHVSEGKGFASSKKKNILKKYQFNRNKKNFLKYKIASLNRPKDYVYWDDPNELVDRLRLLVAEQEAGNNFHVNEINSIIEELREGGYLY